MLLLLPLASALCIFFFLFKRPNFAALLATASVLVTFLLSLLSLSGGTYAPLHIFKHFYWINFPGFQVSFSLISDQLSHGMMIVVTGIGSLVHLFSLGYMRDDEAKARYFAALSLFMFSMTGIVLSNNFVMTFIFWELVGLSSYLLIGHWYGKKTASQAAKKAFLSNRVGDFGFLMGILFLWALLGTFTFQDMTLAKHSLENSHSLLGITILLIFCGAIGKSAQFPLHIWLPDAMEGPTPVSALIHAATMVAAGIYMMARLFLSLGLSEGHLLPAWTGQTIAWIGAITSLLAALIATQQNDIKKILAYSTLSQLGYMVLAVGLFAPEAGMFHLFTHAWFKALLFLGSGAVIYACHHEQDIWKMGGLFKKMPLTSSTFLLGTLSLTALPFTSGFYSKEGILHAAHHHPSLFWIAAFVAILTTFYMFRLFFVAFLGKEKSQAAYHAKEVPWIMAFPLLLLGVMSLCSPFISPILPLAKEWHFHLSLLPEFNLLFFISFSAFLIGLSAAYLLYWKKDKECLYIPLFKNAFYVDTFYAKLIAFFQDGLAAILHFLDIFLIGGLFVEGSARLATGIGHFFNKRFADGKLATAILLTSIGLLLVLYAFAQ